MATIVLSSYSAQHDGGVIAINPDFGPIKYPKEDDGIGRHQGIMEEYTSALVSYPLPEDIRGLIGQIPEEIEDLLIVNPQIVLYGRPATQHRSIGFFSNESKGYKYSNQIAKSIKLEGKLAELLTYVNETLGSEYNAILVNRYSDGTDWIGPHSDDESALDKAGVASISLGAQRKFRIRSKKSKNIEYDHTTNDGELLLMFGDFQKEFTHEIPQEKKIKDVRYSFTFRRHLE